MRMRRLIGLVLSLAFAIQCAAAQPDTESLKIGILSKRGPEMVQQRWSELARYLNDKLPQYQFIIVPLSFEEVEPAVKGHRIDFLLTNSGMFVNLSFAHKLSAIATLKRKILGMGYMEFGSVVFTRSDRTDIGEYKDLKAQRIAAVDKCSLGGWIGALRELDTLNISIKSFASLKFLGTHDAVVYAVENKKADVGIVRTDTLERMASEGKIVLDDFKALAVPSQFKTADRRYGDFPLMLSSRLYPEWPMTSLPHVPDTIAEKVSSALLTMSPDSDAAVNAKIMGWTIPRNYREVDLAYSQLKLGVYQKLANYSIIDVIARYWKYFLIILLFVMTLIVTTLYIIILNKALKRSQEKLKELATHDTLTGLPNRSLFTELANRYLHIAKRERRKVIVMFLDLDRFKEVNDTYGHNVGDVLLKDVSRRIINTLRNNDLLARFGGDEFLIMLWNIISVKNAEKTMKRLIEVVSLPMFTENGERIEVGCSIGASDYPGDGEQLENLIKKADIALYQAKNKGRGKYVFYTE